jgi:hypothetical protein
MANKITDLDIFNAATANNPDGSLKDRVYSAPGVISEEGSRAYGRFFQDVLNVFHRLVRDGGGSLNGATDEQLNSQFYDALIAGIKATDLSISKLVEGSTTISAAVGTVEMVFSNEGLKYSDSSDGSYLELKAGSGVGLNDQSLKYYNGTSGRTVTIAAPGIGIADPAGTNYALTTSFLGGGTTYLNGPGVSEAANKRTSIFNASAINWTVDTGTTKIYNSGSLFTLTGIPFNTDRTYGFELRFLDASSRPVSCPLHCRIQNASGTMQLFALSVLSGVDPSSTASATNQEIVVTYNSLGVD